MAKPQPSQRYRTFADNSHLTHVTGLRPPGFSDVYHFFMRKPFWATIVIIVAVFVVANALFGLGYLATGGVAGMHAGSFWDAFFFSIQTMGTIGYGGMHPTSRAANVLMACEAIFGILLTATSTGLVFAKFSTARARLIFTRSAAIFPLDGVPTLMFRVANERRNYIIEAQLRVSVMLEEKSAEGFTLYRAHDLQLVRDRSAAMTRSWTILHKITKESPLYGMTPARLTESGAEILISLIGTDGTTSQTIHAQHSYLDDEVIWGGRHADMIRETPDGHIHVDFTKFHDVLPTEATGSFPYPASAA
jgi:inward rectifier potassium channel